MITISCPSCHKKLSIREAVRGKKVKCPACGQLLRIPAAAAVGEGATQATTPQPPDRPRTPPDTTEAPTNPPAVGPDATVGLPAVDSRHDPSLTHFLAPAEAPDELGRLGKYRILKILGHGGMGVVYQAEDSRLKRSVAIKAMLPGLAGSASAAKRFMREAQAMAAVEHDNIVRIYDTVEDRGVAFMAMEFLRGEPLDERLKREDRLPIADVLRIGRETAEGLAAAHATGLIHRDIKPGNIWLEDRSAGHAGSAPAGAGASTPCPAEYRVKILDFGLARAGSGETGLTLEGAILGTPAYMSPEQGRGGLVALDARSDLFSLGVVLYRMCAGSLPFQGTDTVSTLLAVATNVPTSPVDVNTELPQELSDLVMKLLEKNPADRFVSAAEVVQAIQAIEKRRALQQLAAEHTDGLDAEYAGTSNPRQSGAHSLRRHAREEFGDAERPRRRRALVWVAALLGVCALLALGAVYYWQTNNGLVRIEINDPEIQVAFDKNGPTVKGIGKQELRIAPGEHGLRIQRGDLEFDTDKFILKRGDTIALKIEWLKEGKIQFVQDGKPRLLLPGSARRFKNGLGMEFVLVPKGTGWLGGGNGQPGSQKVDLPHDFYLGAYPVTEEEWDKVMMQTPGGPKAFPGKSNERRQRLPVVNVSWDMCQFYIRRVNELAKESGWVYRLPTQVEWEYACRGGPMKDPGESGFDYYFDKPSNVLLPQQANFKGSGLSRTIKVGSYPPNRLGLYDMHGNVAQWCDDTLGLERVFRGGTWTRDAAACRAATIYFAKASHGFRDLGLRLARVPAAATPAQPLDLLAAVELPRHVVSGNWRKEGTTLLYLANPITVPGGLKLLTPTPLPEEYELEMVVERLSVKVGALGRAALALGFLYGGRQATVNMEVNGLPTFWALEMVDGKAVDQSPVRAPGARLLINQKRTVRVQIHKQGVRVFCDTEKVIDWSGQPAQLAPQPNWKIPAASLFLGAESAVRIHKLTLTSVGPMPAPAPPRRPLFDLATVYEVDPGGLEFDTFLATNDARDPVRPGFYTKVFQVKLRKGKAYVLDMASARIDSLLRLEDGNRKLLAEDDDSGGGQNSRLHWQPAADGTYRIVATTFGPTLAGNQVGPFRLHIREEPVIAEQSSPLYLLPFNSRWNRFFHANSWITDFSSDGTLFLAAGDANSAGNVPIWEAATGKLVRELVPRNGVWFSNARFVPGSKYMVVAAYTHEKDLYLWDAVTGLIVRKFVGHTSPDPAFAVSPDGKHLLSWANDLTIRLWDLATGKELAKLEGHTDKAKGAFSPDGTRIVTWSLDGTARLWDVATGKAPLGNQLKRLTHNANPTGNPKQAGIVACFSPDGKWLLSHSPDSSVVQAWDIAANREVWRSSAVSKVQAAEFLANGRLVAVRRVGYLQLIDGVTGKSLSSILRSQFGPLGHDDQIAASPDARVVLARHSDTSVRVLDLATGSEVYRYLNCSSAQAFSFSPDGTLAVAGSFRRGIFGFRLPPAPAPRTDLIVRKFEGHTGGVAGVALSGDGKRVLTGSGDRTAILWDADNGQKLQTFQGHHALYVTGVALSANGKRVLTVSADRAAILWDADSGQRLQTFPANNGAVGAAAMSADGKFVVTCSGGVATLWEADSGKQLQTLAGHTFVIQSVALSADGKHVLTGASDKTAILWDANSGKTIRTFRGHTSTVKAVALSTDGKRILTGSLDRTAILWDAATGAKLQTFDAHPHTLRSVALSGDGKFVVTVSNDRLAILWDAASGRKVQTFQGHTFWVLQAALSGDGQRVLTGSQDGTAILWRATP